MKKAILITASIIGFVALAAPPDEPYFGPKPTPAQMKIQMDNYRTTLKDPYSAQITKPMLIGKYKSYKGLLSGGGYHYGWLTAFDCNAKNSYGAYAGVTSEYRLFTYEKDKLTVYMLIDFDKKNLIESAVEPLTEKVQLQGLAATAKFKSGIFFTQVPQGLLIVRVDPASPNGYLLNRIIISVNDKFGSTSDLEKILLEIVSRSPDGLPVKIKAMDIMGNNIREDALQLYKIS